MVCVLVWRAPLYLYYSWRQFGEEYSSDLARTVLHRSNGSAKRRLGPRGGRGVWLHPRCTRPLGGTSLHRLALAGYWLGLGCIPIGLGPRFVR